MDRTTADRADRADSGPTQDSFSQVGRRATLVDGAEAVRGTAVYGADVQLPGMLHARILHGPHGHARLLGIDASRVRQLPGVVDVVTAADAPTPGLFATDEVGYHGHRVAAVAATTPQVADEALDLFDVSYEVLPAVVDPLAGLAHDAPPARVTGPAGEIEDGEGRLLPNAVSHQLTEEGDIEAAFAAADVVVEREYRIPHFHQSYLEPHVSTARVEADGRITVWTTAQGSFNMRDAVAAALRIPHGRIKVILARMGGGFGAKNRSFVDAHAALLAMRTGRPVQVRMSREETFLDGVPAPGCVIRVKTAATRDGTLTALAGHTIWDAGWGGGGGAARRLADVYKIPNLRLESHGVRTNKQTPGAYRAPSAPQVAFARESNMDLLARELGMDPFELRLRNAKPSQDDTLVKTLRLAAERASATRSVTAPNRGWGVACGEWTNASGASNAQIALAEDGSVSVLTGHVDITGVHTVMAQIVAEELGVPVERVTVTLGNTDEVPYTSLSAGSKSAYVAGTAAREAARQARQEVLVHAAEFLEVDAERVEFVAGRARVIDDPQRAVSLGALAKEAQSSAQGPISGKWVVGKIPTYPSFAATVVTVDVDPETGKVQLLELLAVQDVGRALNPDLVEGQIQGGTLQSVALGMFEGYRFGEDGRVLNTTFLDNPIPTALDAVPIEVALVEEPCPHGPYGAKGVGEPPIIAGATAVANAVHEAVGVRVTELPLSPARIVAALARS